MSDRITRRNLIIAGGLGVVAASTSHAAATAGGTPAMTAAEKANVKLVRDFLASWDDPHLDIDKIVAQYMAPTVSVRWTDDMPVAQGTEAAANAAKAGMASGSRAIIKIHSVFVRGPLVATSRTDVIKVPGKPDEIFPTAGMHVVKNGKIQEYTDYVVR